MPLTKAQHLDPNTGPKRILALDGDGVRGVLTLQFLQAIESLIKKRFGDETRPCDELAELARIAAEVQVPSRHFPPAFDLR